jgi:POT family proton-dependent oligopeptide transporter
VAIDGAGPGQISILWQAVPYLIITVAEVLVSITGLEFAYSQAPKKMKSTIMGFWLLTIAFGNILVSLLAEFGKLPLAQFFWLFAGLMLLAGLLFGLRAHFYVERDYIQD